MRFSHPRPDEPIVLSIDVGALADRIAEAVVSRLDSTPEHSSSPWMNVDTAAMHLDCSRERLRKLVQQGRIPFHQEAPGSRVFFNRCELDEWMLGL